jgi:glutamate decarboxylase
MVLAQYYNFVRYGREGYAYVMRAMQENARSLAGKLRAGGNFELIGDGDEQLPLVAFKLAGEKSYDEFDVSWQLSAERGWMVPAYTLPPNAEEVKILRALVKQTLSREQVDRLSTDIELACETLEKKGGAHASERKQMKTSAGY